MKPIILRLAAAMGLAACTAAPMFATSHAPYDRSRIYWDMSTRVDAMPWGGNYGRMVQLLDGRLMIVGSYGGGLAYTISSNYGTTWTAPTMIIKNPAGYIYGSPDFTQLADGTLLVGLNPRPDAPYTTDRRFGIEVLRSTDLGQTWSKPIPVHYASHLWDDGCWEPSFLQLPSGEVQCYYSVELPNCNDQEIMISRSFDNGLTWGKAERVSYRAGYRDGMATAIITDAQEIVGIIEDFGHQGAIWSPRATTFRCTLANNWRNWVDAGSANRQMIFERAEDKKFNSAAPYIRKLRNGETVASWMGNSDGRATTEIDKYPMFVAVGDKDARNFKAVNMPFYREENEFANWSSLGVADDGYVYAMANVGEYGGGCVLGLIKGMPRKGFDAAYGTPKLDGKPTSDPWAYKNGRQLTMGTNIGNRIETDFLYDENNFYLYAYVQDKELITDVVDRDAVFFYLDVAGCCDTYPQEGMFKFCFGTDGRATLRRGSGSKWLAESEPSEITYKLLAGAKYYMMEVAIPWSLLGEAKAPEASRPMRMNLQVRDRRERELKWETIPETIDKSSWTWPELYLGINPNADGLTGPEADAPRAEIAVEGSQITVSSTRAIAAIAALNPEGRIVAEAAGAQMAVDAAGVYIVRIAYADGTSETRKIVISNR